MSDRTSTPVSKCPPCRVSLIQAHIHIPGLKVGLRDPGGRAAAAEPAGISALLRVRGWTGSTQQAKNMFLRFSGLVDICFEGVMPRPIYRPVCMYIWNRASYILPELFVLFDGLKCNPFSIGIASQVQGVLQQGSLVAWSSGFITELLTDGLPHQHTSYSDLELPF